MAPNSREEPVIFLEKTISKTEPDFKFLHESHLNGECQNGIEQIMQLEYLKTRQAEPEKYEIGYSSGHVDSAYAIPISQKVTNVKVQPDSEMRTPHRRQDREMHCTHQEELDIGRQLQPST